MSDCCRFVTDTQIVLKENRSEVRFLNPNREKVLVVSVDGCEISGEEERCDYLVCNNGVSWYIELKGTDIVKALAQIENSFRLLKGKYPSETVKIVVVAVKVPAISNFQKAAKKLTKAIPGCSKDILLKSRILKVSLS